MIYYSKFILINFATAFIILNYVNLNVYKFALMCNTLISYAHTTLHCKKYNFTSDINRIK